MLRLDIDIHEPKGIPNKVMLDMLVEGGISHEAGRVVDLEKVGLAAMVDYYVEA